MGERSAEFVVYEGGGEWSALYIDGKLDRVGDHYLIDERIRQLIGVKTVQSDDFLRGGTQRSHVAPTLEELAQYTKAREHRLTKAAQLRAEAAEKLAEAEKLADV
jgi:hypothetical protein